MFHPLRCTDSLDCCGWSSMQEMWAQDRCGAIGTFHMNSGNNKLFCLCGRKWCLSWPTVACHITMYLNIYTYMCNYIYYLFIFPYIGIWYISHPTFSRWLKRVVCRCMLRLSTSFWILFLKWCFARARHFSIVHTVHVERIILVFLDDIVLEKIAHGWLFGSNSHSEHVPKRQKKWTFSNTSRQGPIADSQYDQWLSGDRKSWLPVIDSSSGGILPEYPETLRGNNLKISFCELIIQICVMVDRTRIGNAIAIWAMLISHDSFSSN